MGSHDLTCQLTQVKTTHLKPQPVKLVLYLPTPEGWKAELTSVTRLWPSLESNPQPLDRKSDALTTVPSGHPAYTILHIHKNTNINTVSVVCKWFSFINAHVTKSFQFSQTNNICYTKYRREGTLWQSFQSRTVSRHVRCSSFADGRTRLVALQEIRHIKINSSVFWPLFHQAI